jgi:hypothetical protein
MQSQNPQGQNPQAHSPQVQTAQAPSPKITGNPGDSANKEAVA